MNNRRLAIFTLLLLSFCLSTEALAKSPIPLQAEDKPDDSGHALMLSWPAQDADDGSGWYFVEAAAEPGGPFETVARFKTNNMWYSNYPEVYGHDNDKKLRHAISITTAPPPTSQIDGLRTKAALELQATLEKIEALQNEIDEQGAEYLVFSDNRKELSGKLDRLSENASKSPSPARLAAYRKLEDLKNSNRRFNQYHERITALQGKKARLESWQPPKTVVLTEGHRYHLRLNRETNGISQLLGETTAIPHGNWINTKRLNNLAIALILAGLILYYTWRAKRNPEAIFVRRIAGLEAVDEAIGRATEMGKPIFFVHGLASISTISTVAAINILGKLAEKVAEYGTEFKVTNRDPVVLAVSQETVKEAYLRKGRPDLYNEDDVFYVSQDQFSYATGVEGMFLRERPASNFFFGYYYAEALLLTETGAHIGAIQIAGTDSYTQLPFFITTCDYTLMGEELYAASAYMSRNPKLLASLKAQDLTKGLLLIMAILGVILSTSGIMWLVHWTESF